MHIMGGLCKIFGQFYKLNNIIDFQKNIKE